VVELFLVSNIVDLFLGIVEVYAKADLKIIRSESNFLVLYLSSDYFETFTGFCGVTF
jgi:hypothetical protein